MTTIRWFLPKKVNPPWEVQDMLKRCENAMPWQVHLGDEGFEPTVGMKYPMLAISNPSDPQ